MRWEKVNFGDLVDFQKKSSYKAGEGLETGLYPFFTSSNSLSKFINSPSFTKKALIFGTGGNASVHFSMTPFSTTTDCLVAYAKNEKVVNLKYIYYYLSSNIHLLEEGFKGAGLKHISKGYINDVEIPLPPLHIQEQIADTLDKADVLCRKDQELLARYDQLAQAIFYDMFGDPGINDRAWGITKLSEVFHKERDGTKCGPFGSALKREEYVSNGIPVWTMDNIKGGKFTSRDCLFITEEKYTNLKPYSVESGDIIISRAGTVGKMCVVESRVPNSVISTNLIRLSLDHSLINPHFFVSLMKFFGSSVGRLKKGAEGSFTHMNTGILNNLEFGLPPISLQKRFVDSLKNIEAQKKIIQDNTSRDFTGLVMNLLFA